MVTTDGSDELRWFSVRCMFQHGDAMYEERITVWRARDFDHAIELAEEEARQYAGEIPDAHLPTTYVEFAQAYELVDDPGTPGAEVFSLIRDSDLTPKEYVDRYFDTGDEHEDSLWVQRQVGCRSMRCEVVLRQRRRRAGLAGLVGGVPGIVRERHRPR